MNAFLNYVIEANLGLCLFILVYWVVLRKENDFLIKRFFLIGSVVISLVLPFIHINTASTIVPSMQSVMSLSWLPEVAVYAQGGESPTQDVDSTFNVWSYVNWIYCIGVAIALMLFLWRLISLIKLIANVPGSTRGIVTIIESPKKGAAYSFFRFIFISNDTALSDEEKELIIAHEKIHAERLHSIDILLMNIVGVFFWFNPVITVYKKTFVHLHEYEADARAVSNRDVNDYCSLLAKVALMSADMKLANHFSNSLTVKRIEMMRTFKSKIKKWKLMALATAIPLVFVVVACQDQVVDDLTELTRNSSNALMAPAELQARLETLKKSNPNATYVLVEFSEKAEPLLAKLEKEHGIPKAIELYTPDEALVSLAKNSNSGPEKISVYRLNNGEAEPTIAGRAEKVVFHPSGKTTEKSDFPTYAIIEYNDMARQLSEIAKGEDEVYAVVEKSAEFPGGLPKLQEFLSANITYPEVARNMGVEGSVYVKFIINKDGSVSDVSVIKGLSPELDKEALRVVSMSPAWIPGEQDGKIVRAQFVIPIKFKLGTNTPKDGSGN